MYFTPTTPTLLSRSLLLVPPPLTSLHACSDATLLFSRAGVVSITNVIPAFDRLDEFLNKEAADDTLQPAIRAACSLVKKTLNYYYEKSDEADVYRVSMGACSLPRALTLY